MKGILTRVNRAKLIVDNQVFSSIGNGIVLFIAIGKNDSEEEALKMVDKIINLRMFEGDDGKMTYSVKDMNYEILCVPNFTLYANIKKGKRPSFDESMPKDGAINLFNYFIEKIKLGGVSVKEGAFGRHMDIELNLDGPVNFILGSN